MSDWLNDLKAGDRVVIVNNYHENLYAVSKVTATQIVCGGSRFRKKDGYAVGQGDPWNRSRLLQPTAVVMERIEDRQLRGKIEAAAKDKATSLATLRAMFAAFKGATA